MEHCYTTQPLRWNTATQHNHLLEDEDGFGTLMPSLHLLNLGYAVYNLLKHFPVSFLVCWVFELFCERLIAQRKQGFLKMGSRRVRG